MRRIGYLTPGDLPLQGWEEESHDAFLQGMRDLGWVAGQNLTIEYRYAERRYDRFPALADELVRAGVELIYAQVGSMATAAQQVTSTIPIVFALTADPVAEGLVASLAQPGGNVTGLSLANAELMAKRVERLKEVAPGITHLAVLRNSQQLGTPSLASMLRGVEDGAREHKMEISYVDHPQPEQAFSLVLPTGADAVLVVPAPTLTPFLSRIAELLIANRLPSVTDALDHARAGMLLSYGASYSDLSRRAATYVDKILKGAKPADLPVEKPGKLDFGINRTTAKALGLAIPQEILAQATEIFE